VALDYVSYRGGRQSASRSARSREYLFVVDTGGERKSAEAARRGLEELASADDALRSTYDPRRVRAAFASGSGFDGSRLSRADSSAPVPGWQDFFSSDLRRAGTGAADMLAGLRPEERAGFLSSLKACACADIAEELGSIAALAAAAIDAGDLSRARALVREAPRLIRKLAHGKYSSEFERFMGVFKSLSVGAADERSTARFEELDELMRLRRKD
jgi:hypothetical protein